MSFTVFCHLKLFVAAIMVHLEKEISDLNGTNLAK